MASWSYKTSSKFSVNQIFVTFTFSMPMQDERKISLCVTTYNRPQLTVKSFQGVLVDDRVSEIIVLDDCSTPQNYDLLLDSFPSSDKLFVYRNKTNLGMAEAKAKAIELASNPWAIIFDSDNELNSTDYVDPLYRLGGWWDNEIYCPSGALPNFNYERYRENLIDRTNVKQFLQESAFNWLINTCNYFVHRDTYLRHHVTADVGQADTIWHAYNHLKEGGRLYVVPNMTYKHLVHHDSAWNLNRRANVRKFNEIKAKLQQL